LIKTIAMTALSDLVTLLYVDDTIGWIPVGQGGTVTITYNTGSL